MVSEIQFSADALLREFFSACEHHFRFLEERHAFQFFCGLAEYRNNFQIIKSHDRYEPGDNFIAITRYERMPLSFEVRYSSDQFAIEGHIFYSPVERFGLSEILSAAKKVNTPNLGDWGVTNQDDIQKTVLGMAEVFEAHTHILLAEDARIIERAYSMRHTRLENIVRQKHVQIIEQVSKVAALAFREKNYKKVIELLQPHEPSLKRAELKKLERAKHYLLSLKSSS